MTIDTLVSEPGCADFMKINIEGGDFGLPPAQNTHLERCKLIVHLSWHAPFLTPE